MKILSIADTAKKIEMVRKSGQQFQNAVQIAAVSIAVHIAQHRNKTLLANLFEAMPNGSRRKTMIDWFNFHVVGVEATYTKAGKLDINLAGVNDPDWVRLNANINKIVDVMTDNPWHAFSAEKGQQDVVTLEGIIAMLEKKNKAANDDGVKAQIGAVIEFASNLKKSA